MTLISSDEAVQSARQHTRPCRDCPWRRTALNGWLGGNDTDEWLRRAHADEYVHCHVIDNHQCAGIAIYRRNVCKLPLAPLLVLPADKDAVFASPAEFRNHHTQSFSACPRADPRSPIR